MSDVIIPIEPNQKAPLRASKWQQLFVLLDADEMTQLLTALAPLHLYMAGMVLPRGAGELSQAQFMDIYRQYVDALAGGKTVNDGVIRSAFSTLWTRSADQLSVAALGEHEQLIRPGNPVIQLRPHRFSYSTHDQKFRSMVLGANSISWGIQFAYPQILQNPVTQEIMTITDNSQFPNTALFKALQRWVRHNTLPTPFVVDGHRTNVPIRLGKACFAWINRHPQLAAHSLNVQVSL